MKLPLLGFSFILGATSFGIDFTKQTDGRIVEYTFIDGKVAFKLVDKLAAGSMYWGLRDIACGVIDPIEKHRTFSGEVADYNIGTPRKGVPIFMVVDDKPSSMVAISGEDGKFSFQIYQAADSSKKRGYILAKDFKEAYLCVGLVGSSNTSRPETPSIGSPFPPGSWTSQYQISDILK